MRSTAFCRIVDDIADDQQGDRGDARRALDQWRTDIDALYAGGDAGQAAFLAPAVQRFRLDRADFDAVIDGMAMDVDAISAGRPPPSSISIAIGSPRRSAASRCACSGWTKRRARAGAPSRPRAPAHQHPARYRRGCRDRPRLSAARGDRGGRRIRSPTPPKVSAIPASIRSRRARPEARVHFDHSASDPLRPAARPSDRAAPDGGGLCRIAARMEAPAGRRRARACVTSGACSGRCCG
jgi:hypothetical protein